MSAKPLADVYEKLKELRRHGAESVTEMPSGDGDQLYDMYAAELVGRLDPDIAGKSHQFAKLIRTLEIKTLADRVFGDEERAEAWLRRPNGSLSGQSPNDLLKDELGTAVVREMLEQIDHGSFA